MAHFADAALQFVGVVFQLVALIGLGSQFAELAFALAERPLDLSPMPEAHPVEGP